MSATSTPLAPVNIKAMSQGRWNSTTFTSTNASAMKPAAASQRTFGRRISAAAAMPLAGQKNVIPPGTCVSCTEKAAATNTARPISASAVGNAPAEEGAGRVRGSGGGGTSDAPIE